MENLTLESLQLTVSELKRKVEDLEKNIDGKSEKESVDLITAREAAAILGIALGSLYNANIEHVKLPNGRVRYSRSAIISWMKSGQQKTKQQEG